MTSRTLATAVVFAVIGLLAIPAVSAGGPSAPLGQDGGSRRIGGADRYATSAAILGDIARYHHPQCEGGAVSGVLVARGDHFADALSASTITGGIGQVPLILTPTAALDPEVERAVADHACREPSFVVGITGDTSVVSERVEQQLLDLDGRVSFRAAGADRYETAALAVEWVYEIREVKYGVEFDILLTSGTNFPDGLAAAPMVLSGHHEALLMLTTPDRLHPAARRVIEKGARSVTILGGTQAVSQAVEDEVAQIRRRDGAAMPVNRIGGRDRTETAALLASRLFDDIANAGGRTVSVALARGDDFPDALGAGVWAGYMSAQPLLLTKVPTELGDAARRWLEDHAESIEQVVVIGGPAAVSDEVFAEAREAAEVTR